MKARKVLSLLFLLAVVVLAACKKDDPKVEAPSLYFIDSYDELIQKITLDDSLTITTVKDVIGMSGVGLAYDNVHKTIYWSDFVDADTPNGKIWKMNLDGTGEDSIVTGLLDPYGIDLDIPAGKVYWTDDNGNISKSGLDGSGVQSGIVNIDGGGMRAIAIDEVNGKMYYYEVQNDKLYIANLDGTNATVLLSGYYGYALYVDNVNNKLYFNDNYSLALMSCNLDGTVVTEVYANSDPLLEDYRIYGIAVDTKLNKIYWSVRDAGEINMANLNGTEKVTLASGLSSPRGIFLKK
jgi:hypothetical protein